MNLKNFVPGEVRLDQARHKARKAFGRGRIVVNLGASEAYRQGWERMKRAEKRMKAKRVVKDG